MEVKKIVEGMTAVEVAEVIDSNFKSQNKILEEDIAKQNNVIGVSEYEDFSEAEAVAVGDVRKYNGFLYECVEATEGAWDESKWKKSSFKAETEKKISELGSKVIDNKLQTTGIEYESTRIIDIASDLFVSGNKVNIVLKSNESESVNIGVIGYVNETTSENLGNIYYKNRVYTYELSKSYIKIRLYNNVSANKYVVDVDVSSIKRSIEDLEKKTDEEVGSLQSSVKDINSELNVVNVTTSNRISEYISDRLVEGAKVIFNVINTLSTSCNITIFGYYSESEYDTLGVIYNKNIPKSVVLGKNYKKMLYM